MSEYILFGLLAGCAIALMAGPLGSLMVWQRLSYFGDALAHSTLLGASIAILTQMPVLLGTMLTCILVAVLLHNFSRSQQMSNDALLTILSYTALAVGLILAAMIRGQGLDLLTYLYGDILAVSANDLGAITICVALVFLTVFKCWNGLVAVALHPEMAAVEGRHVMRYQWLLKLLLACVIAVSMRLVGVLLITALLIIPAAAARSFARSPEQMAIIASTLGMVSVTLGMALSLAVDWPTGPSIVVVAACLFLTSRFFSLRQHG